MRQIPGGDGIEFAALGTRGVGELGAAVGAKTESAKDVERLAAFAANPKRPLGRH